MTLIEREAQQVVNPDDPQMFWHLAVTSLDQHVVDRMRLFPAALADLGIDVSTGPVVDFRLKEQLLDDVTMGVPLIYPLHFNGGFVEWPNLSGRKANAIQQNETTAKWLYPSGTYTLVRRFSSKEEPRRIVATVCELDQGDAIGFENHVNLFHSNKQGLDPTIGRGLAVYLNSTLVDSYLRLFNGHTQVNVTDLRSLPYPPLRVLMEWGSLVDGTDFPPQEQIDDLVEGLLNTMTDISATDPVQAQGKINEALQILVELGLPRAQQNERSALTLLALLNLKPQMSWSESEAPLVGITPIMDFCKAFYGRHYAPNTRETFRRQTIHQFVAVALVVENPDQPDRPKNSPHWAYQIEPAALALLKSFGSDEWAERLADYQADVESLKDRYARARQMQLVPVTLSSGQQVDLSAGEHSELIKAIVEEFAPRFAPAGEVLYLGDTGAKADYFDEDGFANLGITLHKRGKMPDVVIYYRAIGLLTKA